LLTIGKYGFPIVEFSRWKTISEANDTIMVDGSQPSNIDKGVEEIDQLTVVTLEADKFAAGTN
jgi:glutamyl-tRNA reductase